MAMFFLEGCQHRKIRPNIEKGGTGASVAWIVEFATWLFLLENPVALQSIISR